VARGCVEEGVGVTLVARRQDRLEQASASFATSADVVAIVADAGRRAAIDRVIEAHERAHGGLDLVVVAAGGGRPGAAVDTSVADLARALERDLHVPWQVLRASIGALVAS